MEHQKLALLVTVSSLKSETYLEALACYKDDSDNNGLTRRAIHVIPQSACYMFCKII